MEEPHHSSRASVSAKWDGRVQEPSLLVPSKKGFGHAGNVEEVQHLFAGERIPKPSSLSAVGTAHQCRDGTVHELRFR